MQAEHRTTAAMPSPLEARPTQLELATAKRELERIARECGASKAVACAIASQYFHTRHFVTSTPCAKI